jgi:hypothetical protein
MHPATMQAVAAQRGSDLRADATAARQTRSSQAAEQAQAGRPTQQPQPAWLTQHVQPALPAQALSAARKPAAGRNPLREPQTAA